MTDNLIISIAAITGCTLAGVVTALSIFGLIFPQQLFNAISKIAEKKQTWIAAVFIRALLGITLLISATQSGIAGWFFVIGFLLLLSAAVLLIIGHTGMLKILQPFKNCSAPVKRFLFFAGLLIGLLILWGLAPVIGGTG